MDMYLVGSLITISLVGVSYYQGYFEIISEWFNTKRQYVKLLLSLMNNLQEHNKEVVPSFIVNDNDTSASVIYERMGQQYILWVPYERRYIAPMSQFKVELLRMEHESVDITQQPGIPYLVCAAELGGYAIRIINQETGLTYNYASGTAPMYGEELMDDE